MSSKAWNISIEISYLENTFHDEAYIFQKKKLLKSFLLLFCIVSRTRQYRDNEWPVRALGGEVYLGGEKTRGEEACWKRNYNATSGGGGGYQFRWMDSHGCGRAHGRESNIHEIDFFSCWTLLGVKLLATVTDHREVDPKDGDISTPFPSRCQLAGRSATWLSSLPSWFAIIESNLSARKAAEGGQSGRERARVRVWEKERERESKNVEKGVAEAEGVAIEDRENDEADDVEMDREKSLPPRN